MKPELPSRKYFLSAMALSVLLLGAAGRAKAVLIFDNSGRENSRTIRDAGSAPGTFIFSVAQNTLITNISVLNHLNAAGSLRFVIFSHPAETLLFVSIPEAFGADPVGVDTWRRSDDFNFALLAGQQYDIGAIADVPSSWPFFVPVVGGPVDFTQNGITSRTQNANFANFANPVDTGHGGTDIPLRLEGFAAAVAEPSSSVLLGFGALGLLVSSWGRKWLRSQGVPPNKPPELVAVKGLLNDGYSRTLSSIFVTIN